MNIDQPKYQPTHEQQSFDLNMSVMYQGENDPVTLSPLHWHEFLEIILCVESGHTFTVDDKDIELNAGEILIMGANIIHGSFRPSQFVGKQYVIRFHPDMLMSIASTPSKKKYADNFFNYASPYSYHVIRNKSLYDDCLEITKKLYKLNKEQQENSLLAHAYFLMMIHSFLKYDELYANTQHTSNKFTETVSAIKRTAVYIQTHYREKISLEDMAKMSNISYSYYSQLFRDIMGKSFSDFLITVRLAAADDLIVNSTFSMKEIAEKVGLGPQSSFNHAYKKVRGYSPKEFKEKLSTKSAYEIK